MSKDTSQPQRKRMTVPAFQARKGKASEPLVCLTAYTTPMAQILDAHCDLLLVGDSVGPVLHGLPNTIGVTLEHMILHGQAVVRGASKALVAVDMPFGSFEESPQIALQNAVRLLKETGCTAVKLEGGEAMAPTIAFLTQRGVPVIGHVGLLPQKYHTAGGHKAIRDEQAGDMAIQDAVAIAQAGAFAMVVEGVADPVAVRLTQAVDVPTIGIGASAQCDGQILVTEDLLGLFANVPKFVKRFADMHTLIENAVQSYAQEVRDGTFPSSAQTYTMKGKEAP